MRHRDDRIKILMIRDMVFHDDEEKDKEVGEVSDDALEEVLADEDEDEAVETAEEVTGEEKDWA